MCVCVCVLLCGEKSLLFFFRGITQHARCDLQQSCVIIIICHRSTYNMLRVCSTLLVEKKKNTAKRREKLSSKRELERRTAHAKSPGDPRVY